MSIHLLLAAALIVASFVTIETSQAAARQRQVPVPAYADRMLALAQRPAPSPLRDGDAFTGASSAHTVARTFGY